MFIKLTEHFLGLSTYLSPAVGGQDSIHSIAHCFPQQVVIPFEWLLQDGWDVFVLDMPLDGLNGSLGLHWSLNNNEKGDGTNSPLGLFLLPVKAVVDQIRAEAPSPTIMMLGRSGGGCTTTVYAALDPRITVAVPIAGGAAQSMWMSFA